MSQAGCALLCLCLGALFPIDAVSAENAPGNRGVIMRKQPTQEAVPDEPQPAPSAPRESAPPEPRDSPEPQREPVIIPPGPKPTAAGPAFAEWPAQFHDYFGVSPQTPTTDAVLGTLVTYLNRQTLLGKHPDVELTRFEEWVQANRDALPRRSEGVALVTGFFQNLTNWVSLESQYTAEYDRGVISQLVRVVDAQSKLDPGFDEARRQKIVSTVSNQGLFVPAGILFGYSVLPYRAVTLPKGYVPYETQTKPEFSDQFNRAEAVYDFIEAPGPIFRVDFDTIEAATVRVEQSADGQVYQPVQEWKPRDASGVRSPAMLAKPFRARYMKLVVESQKETAVLRNPRVFALKEPAAAISPLVQVAPELDGSFKEASWPRKAQIDGFIDTESVAFAEAQTTARVCHTSDTLFLAIYVREPRMSTMAATMTARDGALWEEESFAITLRPTGQPEFRFIVNPLGAQFDSKDGDDSWDGDWRVVTKSWPVGWSAEIAIPFALLGAQPTDDWKMELLRTRRNVENERSVWVYSSDGEKNEAGLLIF